MKKANKIKSANNKYADNKYLSNDFTNKIKYSPNTVSPELILLLKKTVPFLRKDSVYRVGHSLRVAKFAESLAKKEGADMQVVQFAAILHDIGKYKETKEKNHCLLGAEIAVSILKDFKLSKDKNKDERKKENIIHAIKVHSFMHKNLAETIEAKIIQDADKLDRLSPVRIADYFYYGSKKGKSFSSISNRIKNILKNTNSFNTKSAKAMAEERKRLCRKFMDIFERDFVDEPVRD